MNISITFYKNLIITLVTISILLVIPQSSTGKNYYFSTSIGDDNRTNALAQNPATPWKSISKLNSFFTSLAAGDSVLFKRGESFYGGIKVVKSGTALLPIVIGAYGTGTNPIITGFQNITGWTNRGGNIWESSATTCKSTLNMVTVNGVNTGMGRYPNIITTNGGYLTYESLTATTLTDAELTGTPNWTGAEVVIRRNSWIINRSPITNHVGNVITYTDASSYPGYAGWGYFIQNDIRTLDVTGEWFLNKSTKKLSMYFSGNNPNSYTVKASVLDTLVYSNNKSYLTFTNINFEGGNEYGFYLHNGSYINILNCNVNMIGKDAIDHSGTSHLTVNYCTFRDINNNVVKGNASSTYGYFGNSVVDRCALIIGSQPSGDGNAFGVALMADSSITEYNKISNMGYIGLLMGGNNTIIRNNFVDSTCLVKDDGGGIYIGGAVSTIKNGRLIQNNIVTNSLGNGNGKSSIFPAKANGIYADDYANNITIKGNTVTNCSAGGIYLGFYAHDIVIIDNTLYNNTDNLKITENDLVDNNCVFNGNIFAASGSSNLINAINGSETKVYRPIESFGTWNGNYYLKPFDDKNVLSIRYNVSTKQIFDGVTFNGWSKYDANMHGAPISIIPYKVNTLIGNNKITNGTFTSNTTGLRSSYSATSILGWDNSNRLTGGSARLTYTLPLSTSSDQETLRFNIGAVTAGKKYILKFDLLGTQANKAVMVYMRTSTSPYPALTETYKYYPFTNVPSTNEILLEPTISDPSADVCLIFRDEDGTVYLDNASFFEADVTKNDPDQVIRFEYNASNTNKIIPLSTNYVDVKGILYSNSITLLPYTSSILIDKNSNTILNKPPTIINQNFQINENSISGTLVGNINATDPNSGQSLSYSIISGNTNGAFLINATTGVLTVANPTALNFEISQSFSLIVKVTDNGTPNLSSQGTIAITILNVNEKPAIINQTFSTIANNANGTIVGNVIANDPDVGQTISYSILSGNTNNAFSINASTGILSVATSASLNFQTTPTFTLIVKVVDNGTGNLSNQATITVNLISSNCSATGNILYQVWNNIGTSTLVSSLTNNINYPNNPTSSTLINSMEGTSNLADGYGARIAGYICAPATGSYTLWIASDDDGELWLSSDDQAINKQKIAYVNGYTSPKQWNKYTTQKSTIINLVQGQTYYIEALVKEAAGHDNLAVGWLKPGQTGTVPSEVIPSSVLSPLESQLKKIEIHNPNLSKLNINLLVYPNPLGNDKLNIKIENLLSEATLKIFSITGVECYEELVQNSEIVSINRYIFASGIYIIKVFNNAFVTTTKLVVR